MKVLLLSVLLVAACGPEGYDVAPLPSANAAEELDQPVQTLVSWDLGGPYEGVEEHGLGCTMNGNFLNNRTGGLDTEHPFLPRDNPRISCEALNNLGDYWHLFCLQEHYNDILGLYWEQMDYLVYKTPRENGKQGWLFWSFEVKEASCIHTFTLDAAAVTLYYEWK